MTSAAAVCELPHPINRLDRKESSMLVGELELLRLAPSRLVSDERGQSHKNQSDENIFSLHDSIPPELWPLKLIIAAGHF